MGRSVIPFGERITQARQARGNMTQQRLARLAVVSLRTIERAEASEPIDRSTFRNVVEVLAGPMDASRLEDEMFLYQKFDPRRCEDAQSWLAAATRFDERDEARSAADCVEAVVNSSVPEPQCYAQACIQLAEFYDHLNLFEEAVEVANRVIEHRKASPLSDNYSIWAVYQRGIAFRRMAEDWRSRSWTITPAVRNLLDSARADFEAVRANGDERHRVSALHHLALLDFHVGRYTRAIKALEKCLQMRERAEAKLPGDARSRTRLAYDYRRLGQCWAQLFHRRHDEKFRDRAKAYFAQARTLAKGNARVLREIGDDVKAFGPGLQ